MRIQQKQMPATQKKMRNVAVDILPGGANECIRAHLVRHKYPYPALLERVNRELEATAKRQRRNKRANTLYGTEPPEPTDAIVHAIYPIEPEVVVSDCSVSLCFVVVLLLIYLISHADSFRCVIQSC